MGVERCSGTWLAKHTDAHSAEVSDAELSEVSGKRGIAKCVFVYGDKAATRQSSEVYC